MGSEASFQSQVIKNKLACLTEQNRAGKGFLFPSINKLEEKKIEKKREKFKTTVYVKEYFWKKNIWCKVIVNKRRLEIKRILLNSIACEKPLPKNQEGSKTEISS